MLLMPYFRDSIKAMSSFQRTFSILYMAVSILLDISAILLNGLLAYLIKKLKKTSFIPFWFIYCLSACDIMVGITGLVFHLSLPKWSLDSEDLSWNSTAAFKFHHYFMQTSGQLIIIIAFDRYMNMKYLKKYSRLMSKSKAWFIIVFCIIFGIVFIIPVYTLPEESRASYDLGMNIIRAIGTFVIYIVYIKTYVMIKTRYSALKTDKRNQIAPSHTPNKTSDYQSQQSSALRSNSPVEVKLGLAYDSLERNDRSLSCASVKRFTILAPQNKAFTLPQCSAATPTKVTGNGEKPDDTTANAPCVVGHEFTTRAKYLNVEACKVMEVKQETKSKFQCTQGNQKLQTRMPTPEQDFLKAVLFIILAIFICYLPFLFYMLYTLATKDRHVIVEAISITAVLLNSSMNSIILIFFSKDMQRSIKAIFIK